MATFKSILLWDIFGTWANTPRGQLATEDHGELGPTWSWSGYSGSYAVSRDSEVVLRCLSWCKDFSPKHLSLCSRFVSRHKGQGSDTGCTVLRCCGKRAAVIQSDPLGQLVQVSRFDGCTETTALSVGCGIQSFLIRASYDSVWHVTSLSFSCTIPTCVHACMGACMCESAYFEVGTLGFPTKEINLAVVVIFTFEVVAKIALFGYRDFFCGRDSWCLGCWLLWSVLVTPFRCPKDKHEVLNKRPLHVVSWYAWKAKGATFWLWILQPRWNAFDFVVVALSVAYLKTWADLLDRRPKLWHEFEMAVPCATEREVDTKTKMVNSTDMQNATMNIQRICECMNT